MHEQSPQIAAYLLDLMRQASVQCDDVSLNNATAARQWLKKVAEGALVVTPQTVNVPT